MNIALTDPSRQQQTGIELGTGSSVPRSSFLHGVSFSRWTANALLLNRCHASKVARCAFYYCNATDGLAWAIRSDEQANGLTVNDCYLSSNDQQIRIEQFASTRVLNNTFDSGGLPASHEQFWFNNGRALHFEGNYVEKVQNADSYFLCRLWSVLGASIRTNYIQGEFSGSYYTWGFFRVENSCSGINICENSLADPRVDGLYLSSSASDTRMVGNSYAWQGEQIQAVTALSHMTGEFVS